MATRTRLTLTKVQDRVEKLRAEAAESLDYEKLHGDEDDLWASVLSAIAAGELIGDDAQEAARLAMTTKTLDFVRWFA